MNYNASEQTLGWFRDRYIEGNLEIRPPYQRRPVWAPRQKSNLVESVLMSLPVPEIYIHSTTSAEGRTNYAVVDGQQRIRSILQFIGVEQEEGEKQFNSFALESLEEGSNWRNVTFQDLTEVQKKNFFGYKLAVRFLTNATDTEVRDMFKRLNKFLTKLSDQELRNAIYSGPLVGLATALADDDYWAENGIVSPAIIRRMKDIEFISELLIGLMDGPQSGSGQTIDEYYRQLEVYDDEFPGQKVVKRLYDRTLDLIQKVLPEIKECRWANRTDFYSLFVATGSILERGAATYSSAALRKALMSFAEQVDRRLSDEEAKVSPSAAEYVLAVQKGSSDKSRRATRHEALLSVFEPLFKKKR
jgi:hypothetical protein